MPANGIGGLATSGPLGPPTPIVEPMPRPKIACSRVTSSTVASRSYVVASRAGPRLGLWPNPGQAGAPPLLQENSLLFFAQDFNIKSPINRLDCVLVGFPGTNPHYPIH